MKGGLIAMVRSMLLAIFGIHLPRILPLFLT